jgi:hypothetical protein
MHFELRQHHNEFRSQPVSDLLKLNIVFFKFSKEETNTLLQWEHDKEFEYRQEMYDVIESFTDGDSIVYKCIKDIKETDLKKKLSELYGGIPQQSEKQSAGSRLLKHFFSHLFFEEFDQSICMLITKEYENISSPDKASVLFLSPPVPPPEATEKNIA